MVEKVTKKYYLPTVEIKDQNFMIDGRNVFYETKRNDLVKFDLGQGDDYINIL